MCELWHKISLADNLTDSQNIGQVEWNKDLFSCLLYLLFPERHHPPPVNKIIRPRTGSRTRMSSFLSAVPVQDNILEMEMAGQGRNYSYMFNFEQVWSYIQYSVSIKLLVQEFEHSEVRVWMEDNWQLVCRWASGVYLLMIFGGQYLMAKRWQQWA